MGDLVLEADPRLCRGRFSSRRRQRRPGHASRDGERQQQEARATGAQRQAVTAGAWSVPLPTQFQQRRQQQRPLSMMSGTAPAYVLCGIRASGPARRRRQLQQCCCGAAVRVGSSGSRWLQRHWVASGAFAYDEKRQRRRRRAAALPADQTVHAASPATCFTGGDSCANVTPYASNRNNSAGTHDACVDQ